VLESTFFGVVIIALLFTILSVADDEIAWIVLAIVTWLIAAVTVGGLERPYVVVSNGVVTEHMFNFSGGVFLQYLFLGVALVLIGIFFSRILEAHREAVTGKQSKVD